jgi:hypothetical protein
MRKRARRILTVVFYLSIATLLGVATIVLVAIGKGYSYDFATNRFILNGLLVISSVPNGGTIYVNGRDIHRRTPYRSTYEAGEYDVEVKRPGYQAWHKRVSIFPSEVTFVQYVVMFPDQLDAQAITSGPATGLVASRDRRHLAYLAGGAEPAVWVVDTASRVPTKIYTARPASSDRPAEKLVGLSWSDDASHLLLRSAYGDQPNYSLLPAAAGQNPTDLTATFRFDFNGLTFSPANWRELYWVSPEGLRRLDVGATTVTGVLADRVASFTFAGDRLLYVQTTKLGKSLWSLDRAGHKSELIQSLAESPRYEMAGVNFKGKDYVAVIPAAGRVLTLYSDIFSSHPVATVLAKDVDRLSWSPDGHWLAFYSSVTLGTYDLEKPHVDIIKLDSASVGSLSWFDTAHLLAGLGPQLYVMEFDGDNRVKLPGQAVGTGAAAADGRSIFAILHDADRDTLNYFDTKL